MARGVTKHATMRDWLRSKSPGTGGGGGKNLKGWKDVKTGKGEIDVFIHTKTLPMTVWRHPFPTLITIEDKKTKKKVVHVWSRNYTCHETESVLDHPWLSDRDDPESDREKPFERCGQCKFGDWLRKQAWAWLATHRWDDAKEAWIETKKGKGRGIDPCAVLFDFESEADSDENTTIHVGGFCKLFGKKELPDDLAKAMKHHGISPKDAWKESCIVKPMSVMCVVDNDHPENGCVISEETKELGEKVKEEITKAWDSLEIDIQKKPYCIRWNYDRSQTMGKQYKATAMHKIKPDGRILAAIRGDAPDLSRIETPFDQLTMRSMLERHCKLEKGLVPWDEIFPSKEQVKKWQAEDEAADKLASDADEEEDEGEEGESDEASNESGEPEDSEDDAEIETDEDGEEIVACDNEDCKKPVKISAKSCPHCGMKFDVEEEPEPEPEPQKPMRSRAEAKAASSGNGGGSKKAKAAEPSASTVDDDTAANPDDEIPF